MTFFNEVDPFAAQWLRELSAAGHITKGVVDERSVEDVAPTDLRGYRRVNLFAGIGVWDYALRLAGWDDARPVWTCSCPCQPFSSAGKGGGFGDERHLWPAAFHLVRECRPLVCFGEQVASDDGFAWLDLVQADLEGVGYAVGAVVTPAAGFGAPHGRHRIYWVADASGKRRPEHIGRAGQGQEPNAEDLCAAGRVGNAERERQQARARDAGEVEVAEAGATEMPQLRREPCELVYAHGGRVRRDGRAASRAEEEVPREGQELGADRERAGLPSAVGVVQDDTNCTGLQGRQREGASEGAERAGRVPVAGGSPVGGFWGDADWLPCTDGKFRPVEPGTFPLAHGAAARVGRLRGYGNALVAQQAAGFIQAFLEAEAEGR